MMVTVGNLCAKCESCEFICAIAWSKLSTFAEIAFSQVEITRDRVSGLAVHTKNGKMKTET